MSEKLSIAQQVSNLSETEPMTMKKIEENGGRWQAAGYYLFEDGSKGCFSKESVHKQDRRFSHYKFIIVE